MSLATSSLLSTLTIKQWSARKYDRKISEEICVEKGATPSSGNFNKQLIPKEFLKKVARIVNATRNYHYNNTLAWGHDGTELLPADHYLKYTQVMELYIDEFNAAVEEFITDYPSLITKVMNNLNEMYNSADYPSQDDLRGRFSMQYEISPVPEHGDFRIDLPAEELKKITEQLGDRLADAEEEAGKDLYRRLYTVVAKAVVVLMTPGKVFRNSLILNIIELSDKVSNLNIDNDLELDRIADNTHALTSMTDIEALRDPESSYRELKAKHLTILLKEIEAAFIAKWGEM